MKEHPLLFDCHQTLVEPRPRSGSLSAFHLAGKILDSKHHMVWSRPRGLWDPYTKSLLLMVIWKLLWMIWQAARKLSRTCVW